MAGWALAAFQNNSSVNLQQSENLHSSPNTKISSWCFCMAQAQPALKRAFFTVLPAPYQLWSSEPILLVQVFRTSRKHFPGASFHPLPSRGFPLATLTGTRLCLSLCYSWSLNSWSCSLSEKSHSIAFFSSLKLLGLLTYSCSSFIWWHSFLTTEQLLQAVHPSSLISVRCPRQSLQLEICRSTSSLRRFLWVKPCVSQGQKL